MTEERYGRCTEILIAGFLKISSEGQPAKLFFLKTMAGCHFNTTLDVIMPQQSSDQHIFSFVVCLRTQVWYN